MSVISIETLADNRLDPFRELKHRDRHVRGPLIAEGEKLVRRLIDSPQRLRSVLCTAGFVESLRGQIADDVPIYVAPVPMISELIGFKFHRGILACGERPQSQSEQALPAIVGTSARSLLVACPEIRDPDNLGTIIRTAAAFGASAMLVGTDGTDPFSRRVLRTSMGTVFRLPIVETNDWPRTLAILHDLEFESLATVLDASAVPLTSVSASRRRAVFFGNEDQGLADSLVALCQRRITMHMAPGVDSLNVAVAAGIVLHQLRERNNERRNPDVE